MYISFYFLCYKTFVILIHICRCFGYIEELIHKQEPLITVLRLLVLFSITNAGLPKKHFDYFRQVCMLCWSFILFLFHFVTLLGPSNDQLMMVFSFCLLYNILSDFTFNYYLVLPLYICNFQFRRELLHSYGFEHIATLNNLEKAGLFKKQVLDSSCLLAKANPFMYSLFNN
jgi:hypothetical protein